jgi:signal transduction histidine kinase
MAESSEAERVRRLLDVGRALTTELDTGVVLDRLLEGARAITGARYAAVGVLNDEQTELKEFLTSGIDEAVRRSMGDLPRGRGVLGELIEHPQALRLSDIGQHPSSYGFPAGHPPMRSFLGVPVLIAGRVWGNLYLTEKAHEDFTEADQEAAVILAEWAGIAIENARRFEASERARRELEKALLGLEAIRDVAVAIGEEITLEHVLEIIVKRGRALVSAQSLVIMLRDGPELVVHTSAGHVKDLRGARLPISESTSGQVLERHRPERISDVTSRLRIDPREFGVTDPQTGLMVPMVYRGRAVGILAAFDRGPERDSFTEDDEEVLRTFAASAATAVALAQSVQADRLHSSLVAGEVERSRWARELHDETLQGLGGLRLLLSSALRRGDPEHGRQAMEEAVVHIEREIANLRAIISELRPAALDELGLRTAIEALLDRHRDQNGLQIDAALTLPGPAAASERLDSQIESTVYRLVQEAMTNIVKHSKADRVRVAIGEAKGELLVEVKDDGVGFDTDDSNRGFGLLGMEERVGLAGGTLSVSSGEHGTLVCAWVPARRGTDGPLAQADSQKAAS